jgi:hypothetical protein
MAALGRVLGSTFRPYSTCQAAWLTPIACVPGQKAFDSLRMCAVTAKGRVAVRDDPRNFLPPEPIAEWKAEGHRVADLTSFAEPRVQVGFRAHAPAGAPGKAVRHREGG